MMTLYKNCLANKSIILARSYTFDFASKRLRSGRTSLRYSFVVSIVESIRTNIFLKLLFLLPILTLTNFNNLNPNSLDGTINPIYQSYHQVFHSTDYAKGFIRLNNGFTVLPKSTAYLDVFMTVSGAMNLRETGTLQLLSDLNLDSGFTLSSGGYIKGTGHTISLNNNLTIPENKTLSFNGDTIIEGNGNTLYLDNYAKIFIDSNITLTLKNLTLKTKHNIPIIPPLELNGKQSKLCLSNVMLNPTEDLYFREGQFFIHNDVIFSGSSAFIYESTQNSYITPHSTFKFDPNTTFSYTPTTTFNQNLIVLSDKTSTLYFDGSNLNATLTGMRLTRGSIILENNVNLTVPRSTEVSGLTGPINAAAWPTGIGYGVAWNPQNNYLAAIGRATFTSARFYVTLYNFTGTSLTLTGSIFFPSSPGTNVAWSPDGRYLITGGSSRVTVFDTSVGNLTKRTQNMAIDFVWGLDLSPDGKYLVIQKNSQLAIYSYSNGLINTTPITTQSWTQQPDTMASTYWRPTDGRYFLTGGTSFGLFKFENNTITTISSLNFGSNVTAARWSPDGKMVTIGTATGMIYLYDFADEQLSLIYSIKGSTGFCDSLDWSYNSGGKYLFAGTISTNNFKTFKFDQGKLTLLTEKAFSPSNIFGVKAKSKYIALAGQTPTNGRAIQVYTMTFAGSPTSLSNGIIFGNSSLEDSDYNVNVKVLGNSKVKINGLVMDDSI